MDRRLLLIPLGLILLAGLLAVLPLGSGSQYQPERLRVGVLPDDNEESLRKRHAPLIDYLTLQANTSAELVIPKDYQHLLTLFGQKKIDLAYFGGLTYVQAEARFGAEALVMRDIDTRFSSLFIARSDSAGNTLEDFIDASLCFGSRLSTSGHLMPRHFIQSRLGVNAEQYFDTLIYSGAHDKTAYKVRDGQVSLGVANREIIEKMFKEGRLSRDKIKIIWQTPPYSDYVWAVQQDLNTSFKVRLRDAFLKLSKFNTADRELLESSGANMFLPANQADYKQLRQVAEKMGLLE
jgi:phosphonate transport system substrate-binding protein